MSNRRVVFANIMSSRMPMGASFASGRHPSRKLQKLMSPTRSYMRAKANPSQHETDYYTAAKSLSTSSLPDKNAPSKFPKWWPTSDDSLEKHISFADHIAHVIVPNITNKEMGGGLTCGEVVQWVLRAEGERNSNPDYGLSISKTFKSEGDSTNPELDNRQLEIEAEWLEGEAVSTPLKVLDPAFRHDPSLFPQTTTDDDAQPNLFAAELFALGSVWHLPYSSTKAVIDRFDPSNGIKPTRLNIGDWNATATPGDYFRVHFDPRRFVDTNLYDWGTADGVVAAGGNDKPGVIVARDDEAGYIIVNKPSNIPVHARVDNLLENVASSIGRSEWIKRRESILSGNNARADEIINTNATTANNVDEMYNRKKKNRKQKTEHLVYVATPQRLDQNTSGLLVLASKKKFAAYFAKLLRTKTSGQLRQQTPSRSSSSCGVHKAYRCLVCIAPKNEPAGETPASMASEIDRLKLYTNTLMKHYLEPSIRAPKRFVRTVPDLANDDWAECLLRITKVGEICTVVGNDPSENLSRALWGDYGRPDEVIGVVECEIELLTGRTHQIRGQLAAENFPLVGDVQYGGAVPNSSTLYKERCKGRAESFLDSELLALQCCSLEFLDPLHDEKPDGSETLKRSERWKSFRLDHAFWTPFIDQYHDENAKISSSEATSSLAVEAPLLKQVTFKESQHTNDEAIKSMLPPRVLLSKGSHKYVVVKAFLPEESDNELWFVRSASPEECGGPYHANVAGEVLSQLQSLGYTTTVMGGGRIDFLENDDISHANVFGFSYGFGKGDHEKVASIIEEHTIIVATFDNSDGLY